MSIDNGRILLGTFGNVGRWVGAFGLVAERWERLRAVGIAWWRAGVDSLKVASEPLAGLVTAPNQWRTGLVRCALMNGAAGKLAVVYCRISRDPHGDELGVARQRKECLLLATRLGLGVVEIYIDDDRSAYSGAPRPQYDAMLTRLAVGDVGTLIAWHQDRINRQPRELEDLIDFLETNRVTVHTVEAGPIDLTTPSGRMTARVVGAAARLESEQKSARLRLKARELAERGMVGGGGGRPFGYEHDRVTICEPEASLIRDAARWVIDGLSIGEITRRAVASGVTPVSGGDWRPTIIRRILLRPRIAGMREHRGVIVGKAVWPAIIDEPTYKAVCTVLRAPGRRLNTFRRPYLFTGGIGRCGACGQALIARPRGGGDRCYVCPPPDGLRHTAGCGKIRRLADPIEAEVLARLFAVVADLPPAPVPELDVVEDHTAEVARLDEAMANLARDHYADQLIGRTEYLAARDALAAQLEVARSHTAPTRRRRAAVPVVDLQAAWDDLSHEERRLHIRDWIDAVVVHPATRGRNTFDPTKIEIRWRA